MTTRNSLDSYFNHTVISTYEDFILGLSNRVVETQADIRRLGAAAEACLNFAERAYNTPSLDIGFARNGRKSKGYVDHLTSMSKNFAITRDIANVYKHGAITREGRLLEDSSALRERWTITKFTDKQGDYYQTGKAILVDLLNGETWFADEVICFAIRDWISLLTERGVLPARPHFHLYPRQLVRREETKEVPEIQLEAREGQYHESQPELMVWNYALNKPQPLNGEPYDVSIRINWKILPSRLDGERFRSAALAQESEAIIHVSNLDGHT